MTTCTDLKPRIYVACLAAYNQGCLHGAWIDATQSEWAIWGDIQSMLAASPVPEAEEHAIHDYEGFGAVSIAESASILEVVRLAAFAIEHGALGAAVLEYCGSDLEEAEAMLGERYLGCYGQLADYMQELTEEATAIPELLRCYIDWAAMARDAEMSGDVITFSTAWDAVHVFIAC